MQTTPIPRTVRQAFRIIDLMISPEEKQKILSQSESEFVFSQHFRLGLWIRTNWIYQDENNQGLFSKQLLEPGFFVHEDSLSEDFLHRYYQHLKRQNKAH